jgi:DNA primase
MLRKGSSIMQIPSQLISNSWLISVVVHIALIIALREAYPAKTNHINDEFKKVEFVIYQPEPDKLPQKEIPKDIAKAVSKAASRMKSISVSKQSVVSKPDIISEVKIVSQSKSITDLEVLSSEISKNKLKTIPKPKPKPKPTPNSTIIAKETPQTRNPNQKTALTDASFSDLAARKPEYMDKNAFNDKATGNHKTDLDARLSSQPKKPDQQNRRLVTASDSKSPTNQMGISLNKTLAAAPDAEQIQTKIFEGKKSDNFGKINSKKTLILDLLENTPDTKTASINADLYNQNQSFTTQTQFSTSTKELAVKKQLLKNWATTIRGDIVKRTLESKLSSDVRISFKISRTGEILSIETIGKSVTNESIKNFIDVIRMSGKFPMAPQGLKLDYVTFPVNFRSRG